MAELDLILQLLNPQLWWLWEMVIIFAYFSVKFTRHWNKDRHILLRRAGDGWSQIGEYWTDAAAKYFRTKRKKTFITEPETAAFSSTDLSGQHRTILHDYDKSRPREVVIKPAPNPGKGALKVEIKRDRQGLDPSSKAVDQLLSENALSQIIKANTLGRPDLMFSVMLLGLGLAIGAIIGPYLFPHTVPVYVGSTTTATTSVVTP